MKGFGLSQKGGVMDFKQLQSEIIDHRRNLHKIPELGFLVYKTAAYLKEVMSNYDCTIETVATTGLACLFDFNKEETIAFRADMDALPIEENTGLSYCSTHLGAMHACGHDGHMATMLGFAHLLDSYKKTMRPVNCNVLIIFQPAEETIDGAQAIVDSKILEKYKVKSIFGMHLWPMLEKGEIASRPGPMMAKSTEVSITIEGESSHCGEPEKGIDALQAACDFVNKIYEFKDLYVQDRSILKFGHMVSGTVRNAISPYTKIEGTMRTFQDRTWDILARAMKHLGESIEKAYGVTFSLDLSKSHPAVINDEELYMKVKPYLNTLNYVELRRPVMIAEDFSCFEKVLPGIFFFLGTGTGIPLHSKDFNFDDSILIEGVRLFDTILTGTSDSLA